VPGHSKGSYTRRLNSLCIYALHNIENMVGEEVCIMSGTTVQLF